MASRGLLCNAEVIPSDGIFNSNPRTITDSFFCILFFQQLHLGLKCVVYQFYTKITTFFLSRSVQFDSSMLMSKYLTENDVNMSKPSYRSLTHPQVRQHFLAPVGFTEIPVGYARI